MSEGRNNVPVTSSGRIRIRYRCLMRYGGACFVKTQKDRWSVNMKKIRFWLNNARSTSLPQSIMPAAAAVVMMIGMPGFSVKLAVLAVAGVELAHLSFNLMDDIFDYRSHQTGYRDTLARAGFRARTGKCSYITSGEATFGQTVAVCGIFGAGALICGIVIFLYRGWPVVMIAAITVILGIFYSGKPLRLSYHGLGEPVIGIIFGLLNMAGVAYSTAGAVTPDIIIVGIIMGLLVTNILYTHSFLDYAADMSVNKKTLASLFKTPAERLWMQCVLLFAPYVIVLAAIAAGMLSLIYLLFFVSLPLCLALYLSMKKFRDEPDAEVTWKKWYGPCRHWDAIREAGIDWFMARWMMARNLVIIAALSCCAASILSKVM